MSLHAEVATNLRSLSRVESYARNRTDSILVEIQRRIRKECTRDESLTRLSRERHELMDSRISCRERWRRKLALSPLSTDLVRDYDEQRKALAKRAGQRERSVSAECDLRRRIHEAVLHDTSREREMYLRQLRQEKRLLLFQAKQLRARRDVELTNARTLAA